MNNANYNVFLSNFATTEKNFIVTPLIVGTRHANIYLSSLFGNLVLTELLEFID